MFVQKVNKNHYKAFSTGSDLSSSNTPEVHHIPIEIVDDERPRVHQKNNRVNDDYNEEIASTSYNRQYMTSPVSNRSGAPSYTSTLKTQKSQRSGAIIETTAAPNPFCPNIRGMCCLMLLLNLGLALFCLGLMIVLQYFHFFVWFMGWLFLVSGIVTIIGSLMYCAVLFREAEREPEDYYWTHQWRKNISLPEISSTSKKTIESDRYSMDRKSSPSRY